MIGSRAAIPSSQIQRILLDLNPACLVQFCNESVVDLIESVSAQASGYFIRVKEAEFATITYTGTGAILGDTRLIWVIPINGFKLPSLSHFQALLHPKVVNQLVYFDSSKLLTSGTFEPKHIAVESEVHLPVNSPNSDFRVVNGREEHFANSFTLMIRSIVEGFTSQEMMRYTESNGQFDLEFFDLMLNRSCVYLVGEHRGQFAGHAIATICQNRDDRYMFIHDISTTEHFRGRGCGDTLLCSIFQKAKSHRCRRLVGTVGGRNTSSAFKQLVKKNWRSISSTYVVVNNE